MRRRVRPRAATKKSRDSARRVSRRAGILSERKRHPSRMPFSFINKGPQYRCNRDCRNACRFPTIKYDSFPGSRSAHFRRRSPSSGALRSCARQHQHADAAHAQHPPEYSHHQRRHGHGDRVAHGDCPGAAGRPGHCPPQPDHRAAGQRSRQGEALGERHDRRSSHHVARRQGFRRARCDEEIQDFGRAHHAKRRQTGRHPHQPRPALRDALRHSHQQGDDARTT